MPVDESRFERVPALNSMHASTWPFIRATSKNGPLQPSDIQEKEKPVTKNIRAHRTQNEPEFKEMGGLQRPLTDGYMRIFFRTKAYIYIYIKWRYLLDKNVSSRFVCSYITASIECITIVRACGKKSIIFLSLITGLYLFGKSVYLMISFIK